MIFDAVKKALKEGNYRLEEINEYFDGTTKITVEIDPQCNSINFQSNTASMLLTKDYVSHVYANPSQKVVVVIFKDGTKEIVRCAKTDEFDIKVGVALAIAYKLFGSRTQLGKFIDNHSTITEYKPEKEPEKEPEKTKEKN